MGEEPEPPQELHAEAEEGTQDSGWRTWWLMTTGTLLLSRAHQVSQVIQERVRKALGDDPPTDSEGQESSL